MLSVPRAGFCTAHRTMLSAEPARLLGDSIRSTGPRRSLLNAGPLGGLKCLDDIRLSFLLSRSPPVAARPGRTQPPHGLASLTLADRIVSANLGTLKLLMAETFTRVTG